MRGIKALVPHRRALPVALVLALSACAITGDAERSVREGVRLTEEQLDASRAAQRGEVLRVDRPYYGSAVPVRRGSRQGDALPKRLEGARGVSIRLPGQSDIRAIAAAITDATDLPVNIRTRYILPEGDVVEVPIGTRMALAYEGPLSALLDRIGARMDVGWTHERGTITINRMITRDFRVALPLGTTTLSDTTGIASGASITSERALDPWGDLSARLAPLAPAPARVTLAPATGRVTIFGPPSVQAAARKVIEDTKATASARIGLEVGVYFVDSDKAEEFGLRTSGFQIGQNIARSGSSLIIGDGGVRLSRGDSAINLDALSRERAVVDYRRASAIGQSGTIIPIDISEDRSYIANVTTERGDDNNPGTAQYEIGALTTGLQIVALPRLIDDQQIQLSLTISQRAFRGFDPDVLSRTGTIQAPTVDNRALRNETVLAPGEVLVLSGYEQERSLSGASGLGFLRAIGLGGKREAGRRKVRMVVLVRPSLIPGGGRS